MPRCEMRWLFLAIVASVLAADRKAGAETLAYRDRDGNVHLMRVDDAMPGPTRGGPVEETLGAEPYPFAGFVEAAARAHAVPAPLLRAMVSVESGFQPLAISRVGARGLMQIMPDTANELGLVHPFDPQENIDAGARYLRSIMDRFQDDLGLSLAAYNAGSAAVQRAGGIPSIPETQRYVSSVLSLYYAWSAPAALPHPTRRGRRGARGMNGASASPRQTTIESAVARRSGSPRRRAPIGP